ncbi:ammonia permease [Zymobacter palmae]|uniref:Ammonia permease n=1 Tax=Zymobacter palmae TaxID=33074 RepID=A0A348HG40_9GAMM|nr:ammonia permease [Zymobacter palmae]
MQRVEPMLCELYRISTGQQHLYVTHMSMNANQAGSASSIAAGRTNAL